MEKRELFKPFYARSVKKNPYLFIEYIRQQFLGIAILKMYMYLLIHKQFEIFFM